MENIKVNLHKKGARLLKRDTEGQWLLDSKEIGQEQAVSELVEAVQDLGGWCQVAKDVLDNDDFDMVQESYNYHEE
ncbi:hypothetical protein [Aquibacillus saliphilus]|uniref:hypothetical protein n=1 Tax=Aquibacillus saliphilus TaxID=1909422 RepID=UPI001CF00BAB|nr:hypothetical protein [Aquibacillus saliphilus]